MIHLLVRSDDSLLRIISLDRRRRFIVLIRVVDVLGEGRELGGNCLNSVSERKSNSSGWAADLSLGNHVDSVQVSHSRIIVVGLLRKRLIGGVDIGDGGSSTHNGDRGQESGDEESFEMHDDNKG